MVKCPNKIDTKIFSDIQYIPLDADIGLIKGVPARELGLLNKA